MSTEPEPSSAAPLVRALGTRALAMNIVNCLVGSGIFVLPGSVAALLGASAVVAYVLCAAAMGLIALCLAEAGSRVHAPGGVYAYIEAAFGPAAGFVGGALFWLSLVGASAALTTVVAGVVVGAIPGLAGPVAKGIAMALLLGGLAAANVRGVRSGARLMEAVTSLKLLPLVLLVLVGLFAIRAPNLAWSGLPAAGDLGRAALLLIFAFMGIETALGSSGEVRDPARTVPRAILLGLAAVAVLYAGIQVVSQGVMGPALATSGDTPLVATAARAMGPWGARLLLAATSLAAFGYLSGDMLASPRLLYAFSRGGLLPRALGAVHPRFRTPHVAIAVYAATCLVLAVSGTFETLVLISVVATLLVYLGCCLAVLELRRRGVGEASAPFRAPGGPVVPLLASGVVFWLMAQATAREFAAVGITTAAALAIYLLRRRHVAEVRAEAARTA